MVVALWLGGGAQAADGVAGQRKRRHGVWPGAQFADEAVDDAAGGPSGEQGGQHGVFGERALQGLAVQRAGAAFVAQQISSADLDACRSKCLRRGYAAGIGNPAGGDHGHVQRGHQLRQQGKGADLTIDISAEKHAAMAAGFDGFLRKPVTGAMLRGLLDATAQSVG